MLFFVRDLESDRIDEVFEKSDDVVEEVVVGQGNIYEKGGDKDVESDKEIDENDKIQNDRSEDGSNNAANSFNENTPNNHPDISEVDKNPDLSNAIPSDHSVEEYIEDYEQDD